MSGVTEASSNNEKYDYLVNPERLTTFLKVMLWTSLGVALLSLISNLMQLHLLSGATLEVAAAQANDTRQRIVAILYLVIFIVTAIFFLKWIYRANKNCHGFGGNPLEFTPGWSVGYYFIPVINLYMPYRSMKEIWMVSTDPAHWENQRGSALLVGWWALWLISNIVAYAASQASSGANTLASLHSATIILTCSNVINVLMYAVALRVIIAISTKQHRLVGIV